MNEYKDDNPFHKGLRGLIPWSVAEWNKAAKWEMEMMQKPRDDWDLKERGLILVDDETGEKLRITFNPFIIENQLSMYFIQRYKKHELAFAHSIRYYWIKGFINDYMGELKDEGFIVQEGGATSIHEALIEALCILPFSEMKKGETGSICYKFSHDEVMDKAWELLRDAGKN
jgi:hypothetical protein